MTLTAMLRAASLGAGLGVALSGAALAMERYISSFDCVKQDGATNLQLVELEVPARPVRGVPAGTIWAKAVDYDRAYFDLPSTGGEATANRTYRFHMRGGSGRSRRRASQSASPTRSETR